MNKESCLNCVYLIGLFRHPNNNNKSLKGNIEEFSDIYSCNCGILGKDKAIVLDDVSGVCELFLRKDDLKNED